VYRHERAAVHSKLLKLRDTDGTDRGRLMRDVFISLAGPEVGGICGPDRSHLIPLLLILCKTFLILGSKEAVLQNVWSDS
jgi:hypothetical protein